MNKLYLLDAYALIYRAYYAFIRTPRINSKGLNTSAIYGFINTLEEILKLSPTHIAVAFDPKGGKTFRNAMYSEYKANREATPEDIRLSVPIIKDIIRAYNITLIEVENFEADDVIGTASKKFAAADTEICMITGDKDYGQLVNENVFMLKPMHGGGFEKLGVDEIKTKYGIKSTEQIVDMLGLMGDSADNIPGCPGVGEKTATKLLAEYGNTENIISNAGNIKGALGKKIQGAIEQIRLSKKLAEIRTDVPLPCSFDQLKTKEPDKQALKKIYTELEFQSLLKKLGTEPEKVEGDFTGSLFDNIPNEEDNKTEKVGKSEKTGETKPENSAEFPTDGKDNEKYRSISSLKTLDHDYHLVENEDKMRELCQKLLSAKFISLDTETTSTDAINAELVGLSFSTKEFEAFYVPISENREIAKKTVDIFKPVYESEIPKIGQNIKYDMLVLRNYGITLGGKLSDTMIAHYLLQPELPHNMDTLAEKYLDYSTIKIDTLIGAKGKNQKNMRDLSPTEVYEYACEDADVTLKLWKALEPEIEKAGMQQLFNEVEMPLVRTLAEMEENGVELDTGALKETSELFTRRMEEYEEEVYKLAGERFNLSSPKQTGEILFDKLKVDANAKKTKKGQYSTSEEVLSKLENHYPIVNFILKYRRMKKLVSTYLDALPKIVNPTTGKIHTSFNQAVTATGRLSSSNPNLQNIPVRGDDGKEIRKAFVPEKGCEFFSADYSQIELRIMAHLSHDEHMIAAFNADDDIHAATAAKIYHKPISEVTSDERRKAKTANFGIIYGISAFGLAERLNIQRREAKELIDNYFAEYPRIKQYMEESIAAAREKGYIETLLHRRRYLPDINSANHTVRGYAERNAVNAPIQGSAADIIKIAMVRITERFKAEKIKSKMILQVHDELNFSVFPEEKEKVQEIVVSEMENAFHLSVPLKADFGWGKNWLEAH